MTPLLYVTDLCSSEMEILLYGVFQVKSAASSLEKVFEININMRLTLRCSSFYFFCLQIQLSYFYSYWEGIPIQTNGFA